jgi:hypothetical protein
MPERGYRNHFTNHLMGEGYFVWLIQLGTGPISLGVCADMRFHPFETINTLEAWLGWMRKHEPQMAATVEARRDDILDFLTVEDYAYSSTRAFSADRWATTGEAGTFADPFLSPGSDYIAYANTYITDLVNRELEGEDISSRADLFDFLYFRSFAGFFAGVAGQYDVFAKPEVMVPKLAVTQVANFALIGALFGHGKLTDLDFMGGVFAQFPRLGNMANRVRDLFAAWAKVAGDREWEDLNPQLTEFPARALLANLAGGMDDEALKQKIEDGIQLYEALAVITFHEVAKRMPGLEVDESARLNPAALSLDPARWEDEGLFDDEQGITLADARARVPGWDEIWLNRYVSTA